MGQNKSPNSKVAEDVLAVLKTTPASAKIRLVGISHTDRPDRSIEVPIEKLDQIVEQKPLSKLKHVEDGLSVKRKKVVAQKEKDILLDNVKEATKVEKSPKKNIRKNEKFILSKPEKDQSTKE